MFNKWRKYSYAAQKSQRHQLWWILIWFGAFFILYTIITAFFFMAVLENDTMQPGLHPGDRFIFSSCRLQRVFSDSRDSPFRRGNVVLVDLDREKRRGVFSGVLDGLFRFFTLQRLSLNDPGGRLFIKRVIGLPGDEISMINFVFKVKPAGEVYDMTEFELTERSYTPIIPQVPVLWDESIPFSGNMDPVILGDNECFLLSDDRSNTNDSRTWGPVDLNLIAGKAVFRYWPFTRLGQP
ncbi:MAG: signal peptidase I [Treponema sp.]|jgi:signal peptidase I|nr:signal peptidase I [Treponema sp.]